MKIDIDKIRELRKKGRYSEAEEIKRKYLEEQKKRWEGASLFRKRKNAGVCVQCGKEKETKLVKCNSCREKTKKYMKKYRKTKQND